jgi:hypothetical protein
MLDGPTAIAFIEAEGDMVAVAKALADSARTTKILAIRGGLVDGSPIGEEEVKNLATLPPLDVLRGQVLGAITAPLMTVVGLISAPVRDLLGLIDARIEQLQAQGDTSADAVASEPAVETRVEEESADAEPATAEAAAGQPSAEEAAEPVAAEATEEEPVTDESADAEPAATHEAATEPPSEEEQ